MEPPVDMQEFSHEAPVTLSPSTLIKTQLEETISLESKNVSKHDL